MKKADWGKVIKKHFGYEPFTIDDLQDATGVDRTKAYRALGYHTNAGTLKRTEPGMYKLREDTEEPDEHSNFAPSIQELLKGLIKEHGDEPFDLDQAIKIAKCKRPSIHAKMHILFKGRLVERIETGVYKVTDRGHNAVAGDFKKEREKEKKEEEAKAKIKETAPECLPSCILMKMEKILGKNELKNWVYAIAITNEECVTVLEEEAVRSIAKTFTAQ